LDERWSVVSVPKGKVSVNVANVFYVVLILVTGSVAGIAHAQKDSAAVHDRRIFSAVYKAASFLLCMAVAAWLISWVMHFMEQGSF
jgi:hypothetical protein